MTETRSLAPLGARYGPDDLSIFTKEERARFVLGNAITEDIAWQLLYRLEPDLYERLIAGEKIHPDVIAWLPERAARAVEIAAGTGRLTVELSSRCEELIAVEPAAPLRERLRERVPAADVREGFFDAIPVRQGWADLVVSCSAFTSDPAHGGEPGLTEMERVAASGALIALVWPADVEWLQERGFTYQSFDGDMSVEFASVDEAVDLARIFYPDAAAAIAERGSASVPYDVLDMNPPRDVAWRRMP